METVETKELSGAFMTSLTRNNKEIRKERAAQIGEDTELEYKRKIEDMERDLRILKRNRDLMIDLSPTTADSLVLAADFKSKEFVEKDLKYSIDIRNLGLALEIAKERFDFLFKK
jgi:hypothetical protein